MEPISLTTIAWLIPVLIIVYLWDITWKMIAMWKAARANQVAWFICIAVFKTLGILPIVYIFIHRKK